MTKINLEAAVEAVQTVLAANTEIVAVETTPEGARGPKGHYLPKVTTFTLTGKGVSTPFNRHYLKTRKLGRLELPGVIVTVNKTARKSGVTTVTVMPAPKAPKTTEAAAA